MHLDYIRSFCRVVKVKSITKAAGELHLSQPALSLQINCLESRFGTKLLERTNRGVKLTASGELVYRYGQRLLSILDTLDQELQETRNPAGLSLKIAASSIPGSYLLPVNMLEFARENPENKFSVTIKPVADVIDSLMDRTANIGIIEGPISKEIGDSLREEKIALHPLGHDRITAVCHDSSPWSGKPYQLKDLSSLPLIIPRKSCGCRAAIDAGLREIRLIPEHLNVILELDNCTAIASATKASAGVGLIPALASADIPGLECLNIPDFSLNLPFTLLVSSSLEKTPAIQGLMSCLTYNPIFPS